MKRKIIVCFLTIGLMFALCSCGSASNEASTSEGGTSDKISLSESIENSKNYIDSIFDEEMKNLFSENADLLPENADKDAKLKYAEPYVVYYVGNSQDAIYYYPVYNEVDNNIYAIIGVMPCNGSYTFSISPAGKLNEIDYLNSECIVYAYADGKENVLCYENKDICVEERSYNYLTLSDDEKEESIKFKEKSFNQKKDIIREDFKKTVVTTDGKINKF